MSYSIIPITSAGVTINPYITTGVYADIMFTSAASVTLAANVIVNPTVVSGAQGAFKIRWNASLLLSTFSVSICGTTFNQDSVNQPGSFDCFYDGSAWTVFYVPDSSQQPQESKGVGLVTAATSGTTTWVAGSDFFYQKVSGAPTTLVGNLVYTAATSGVKGGTMFFVEIAGGITLSSSSMTVFGQTILSEDALNGGAMVIACFNQNSSTWTSVYVSKALAITQFPIIAALTVLANATNASAKPTAVAAGSEGQVFMRRSNALGFNFLEADNFLGSTELWTPVVLAVEINSAALLTSFATPVVIASASTTPGGGYPVFLGALFFMESGGVAYAANTNIGIRYTGSGDDLAKFDGALAITPSSDYTHQIFPTAPSSGAAALGTQIELYTKTGNPTTGTRTLKMLLFLALRPAP